MEREQQDYYGDRFDTQSKVDLEEDFDEQDEEAERVREFYDSVADKLSPETRDKMEQIMALIESGYDPENEDWNDLLSKFDTLITKFDNAADEQELQDLETDLEDETDGLLKTAKSL